MEAEIKTREEEADEPPGIAGGTTVTNGARDGGARDREANAVLRRGAGEPDRTEILTVAHDPPDGQRGQADDGNGGPRGRRATAVPEREKTTEIPEIEHRKASLDGEARRGQNRAPPSEGDGAGPRSGRGRGFQEPADEATVAAPEPRLPRPRTKGDVKKAAGRGGLTEGSVETDADPAEGRAPHEPPAPPRKGGGGERPACVPPEPRGGGASTQGGDQAIGRKLAPCLKVLLAALDRNHGGQGTSEPAAAQARTRDPLRGEEETPPETDERGDRSPEPDPDVPEQEISEHQGFARVGKRHTDREAARDPARAHPQTVEETVGGNERRAFQRAVESGDGTREHQMEMGPPCPGSDDEPRSGRRPAHEGPAAEHGLQASVAVGKGQARTLEGGPVPGKQETRKPGFGVGHEKPASLVGGHRSERPAPVEPEPPKLAARGQRPRKPANEAFPEEGGRKRRPDRRECETGGVEGRAESRRPRPGKAQRRTKAQRAPGPADPDTREHHVPTRRCAPIKEHEARCCEETGGAAPAGIRKAEAAGLEDNAAAVVPQDEADGRKGDPRNESHRPAPEAEKFAVNRPGDGTLAPPPGREAHPHEAPVRGRVHEELRPLPAAGKSRRGRERKPQIREGKKRNTGTNLGAHRRRVEHETERERGRGAAALRADFETGDIDGRPARAAPDTGLEAQPERELRARAPPPAKAGQGETRPPVENEPAASEIARPCQPSPGIQGRPSGPESEEKGPHPEAVKTPSETPAGVLPPGAPRPPASGDVADAKAGLPPARSQALEAQARAPVARAKTEATDVKEKGARPQDRGTEEETRVTEPDPSLERTGRGPRGHREKRRERPRKAPASAPALHHRKTQTVEADPRGAETTRRESAPRDPEGEPPDGHGRSARRTQKTHPGEDELGMETAPNEIDRPEPEFDAEPPSRLRLDRSPRVRDRRGREAEEPHRDGEEQDQGREHDGEGPEDVGETQPQAAHDSPPPLLRRAAKNDFRRVADSSPAGPRRARRRWGNGESRSRVTLSTAPALGSGSA